MNSPFVSDEGDRQEDEHDNEDNPLFVFRELENVQEPLHSVLCSFGITFVVLERLHVLIHVAVMLSEAKHLWLLRGAPDWRIRDSSLRSE